MLRRLQLMRLKSLKYPTFLLYELIRLWALLQQGATGTVAALPLTWYAAVPLLCLVPALLLMLCLDEENHTSWLPLITLIKALGIPGLVMYIASHLADAIRFGAVGDLTLMGRVLAVTVFIIGDIIIGILCIKSAHTETVCK